MKSVKELRKKAKTRARPKSQMYSTSEARANFAEALESAQLDKAVIGFDRYGRPVAALVPLDAVRMLAGQEDDVDPAVRQKIQRLSQALLFDVPVRAAPPGFEEEPAEFAPAKKASAPRPKPKRRVRRKTLGKIG